MTEHQSINQYIFQSISHTQSRVCVDRSVLLASERICELIDLSYQCLKVPNEGCELIDLSYWCLKVPGVGCELIVLCDWRLKVGHSMKDESN